MARLIFRKVIPVVNISFLIFTKCWYALPTDAPDTIYSEFISTIPST
jgi:hypothetical protein